MAVTGIQGAIEHLENQKFDVFAETESNCDIWHFTSEGAYGVKPVLGSAFNAHYLAAIARARFTLGRNLTISLRLGNSSGTHISTVKSRF